MLFTQSQTYPPHNSFILAEVIASKEVSSARKQVQFKAPDKRTPLMSKCEMYNSQNEGECALFRSFVVMISTAVEDIPPCKTFLEKLIPFVVIGVLIRTAHSVWKKTK